MIYKLSPLKCFEKVSPNRCISLIKATGIISSDLHVHVLLFFIHHNAMVTRKKTTTIADAAPGRRPWLRWWCFSPWSYGWLVRGSISRRFSRMAMTSLVFHPAAKVAPGQSQCLRLESRRNRCVMEPLLDFAQSWPRFLKCSWPHYVECEATVVMVRTIQNEFSFLKYRGVSNDSPHFQLPVSQERAETVVVLTSANWSSVASKYS